MEELVTIGQITKNQGNKGEVRIYPLTDFPERFELLEKVFLEKDEAIFEKEIETVRIHNGKFIVIKFKDINNIADALELRDFLVKIPRELMIPLKEDEYYIDEITDFEVITENEKKLGILKEVLSTGGTDVFIVKGNSKEYMIPASKEIVEIKKDKKLVIVKPIPGLLEL
ncbi:MAG: ribosome maturation factor RimM [Bacillota bacterium]